METTKDLIRQTLKKSKQKVERIIAKSQSGKLSCQPGKNMQESFEATVNKALNEARDRAGSLAFRDL
jgi:DNA-directed RNA polymerase II subunit RPB1